MKLRTLLPLLLLLPGIALAQSVTLQAGNPKPTADIYGDLPICLGPVNVEATACDADGNRTVVIVGTVPTTAATFAAETATGFAAIGAGFALGVDLPDGTKVVVLDNQTNGDVVVSMDAGVTTFKTLKGGDTLVLPLAQAGLITTGIVHLKDGTTAATAGSFLISSYK